MCHRCYHIGFCPWKKQYFLDIQTYTKFQKNTYRTDDIFLEWGDMHCLVRLCKGQSRAAPRWAENWAWSTLFKITSSLLRTVSSCFNIVPKIFILISWFQNLDTVLTIYYSYISILKLRYCLNHWCPQIGQFMDL